jgi:ribonuclease Z
MLWPSRLARGDLVNGSAITLPDGRTIQPDDVLGPERPGTRLVHIGDVGRTDELVVTCKNADTLVIESTYLDEEAEMAHQFAHMTARGAAELAVQAGVGQLILTHLSRRYRERDILTEARSIFPNTVVARDFDDFQVRQGACVKVEKSDEG